MLDHNGQDHDRRTSLQFCGCDYHFVLPKWTSLCHREGLLVQLPIEWTVGTYYCHKMYRKRYSATHMHARASVVVRHLRPPDDLQALVLHKGALDCVDPSILDSAITATASATTLTGQYTACDRDAICSAELVARPMLLTLSYVLFFAPVGLYAADQVRVCILLLLLLYGKMFRFLLFAQKRTISPKSFLLRCHVFPRPVSTFRSSKVFIPSKVSI